MFHTSLDLLKCQIDGTSIHSVFTIYSGIIQIINQIIRKRDAIHRQAVAVLCRNLYRIKYQTIVHSTLNMVASSLSILPHPVAVYAPKE